MILIQFNLRSEQQKFARQASRFTIYLFSIMLALAPTAGLTQSTAANQEILAGHVIVVTGPVVARDASGSDRALDRRASIYVGDTIYTAPNATTQLRMVDGALLALKESTQFSIVAYQYEDNVETDRSSLELIEGGFRTITGAINKESYQATIANFATIGIRGTDYEVVITPVGEVLTGVYDGGTTITNPAGSIDLGFGAGVEYDFARVPNAQTPPQGLTFQPPGLGNLNITISVDGDDDGNNDSDGNSADNDDSQAAVNANDSDDTDDSSSSTDDSDAAPTLAPPSTDVIAATPAANTAANEVGARQEQSTNVSLQVNPNETSGNGAVSCQVGSAACQDLSDRIGTGNGNNGVGNGNGGPNDDDDDDTNGNGNGNNGVGNGNGGPNDDDDDDTNGNGNNGNNGNNGSNGNNGNGRSNSDDDDDTTATDSTAGNSNTVGTDGTVRPDGTVSSTLSVADKTVDSLNVNWGQWDSSLDQNWIVVQELENELVRISSSNYFADVNPTPVANLSGSHTYRTGIASAFIGSGSAGDISSLAAAMDVNFDTGLIDNGSLRILSGDQTWNISFDGLVQSGMVDLTAIDGQLIDATGTVSNRIDANLGGVFTGGAGEAFIGGFDLLDEVNGLNKVDGIYTIER
jgi:hypothetical protein